MDPNAAGQAGGSTFYSYARQQKEAGATADSVVDALVGQGMDPNRAREMVSTLYASDRRRQAVSGVGSAVGTAVGTGAVSFVRPLAAAAATAIAAAILWGVFAGVTHLIFYWAAWGLGAAVGFAVYVAAPEEQRGNAHLMLISFAASVFGIFLGLYIAIGLLAHELFNGRITSQEWFTPRGLSVYFSHLDKFTNPMLLVSIVLAVISALKISSME